MKTLFVGMLLVLSSFSAKAAEPSYPLLTGRVVDSANQIPQDQEKILNDELTTFEKKTGHQFVVVTVPDFGGLDVKTYSFNLSQLWKIGRDGADDGVILLQSPGDGRPGSGKIRIEVGDGLEYALTDVQTGRIIREVMVPILKQDKAREQIVPEAILAGSREIMKLALVSPEEKAVFDKEAEAALLKSRKEGAGRFGILLSMLFGGGVFGFLIYKLTIMSRNPERKSKSPPEVFFNNKTEVKTAPLGSPPIGHTAVMKPSRRENRVNYEQRRTPERHEQYVPPIVSSYSPSPSSSYNETSLSSSDDNYSGGGGSFSGGGSDSDY